MAQAPTEYVTLVSNDGFEFKVLRSAACIAGTIKKALDPQCTFISTVLWHSSFYLHLLNQIPHFLSYFMLTILLAGFRETTENRVDLPTIKYALSFYFSACLISTPLHPPIYL